MEFEGFYYKILFRCVQDQLQLTAIIEYEVNGFTSLWYELGILHQVKKVKEDSDLSDFILWPFYRNENRSRMSK